MSSFLKACGACEPLQLAIRGPVGSESEVRLLHQPFALVGREPRADIPLDHSLVSRRHVYLQIIGGEVFWIDLDSRSGTFSEGRLRDSGWLDHGKVIRVGPFGLERPPRSGASRERRVETRISPLIARSLGDRPLPEVFLEFLNGPSRSACWPMNRVMSLVGSTGGCKFRLDDPSVAPFHCCLVRTPVGLWVVDLLGYDGIGVNDAERRHALLSNDDVLRIGRYRIRIRSRFAGPQAAATVTKGGGGSTEDLVPRPQRLPGPLEPILPSEGPESSHDLTFAAISGSLVQIRSPDLLASPDWVSTANDSVLVERGNLSESLLVSVVNQFGLMQQQMLDQFQQTISILVQAFGNLHREQMDTIRDELDQIRRLTGEFQALKLELAARTGEQSVAAPADARLPSSGDRAATFTVRGAREGGESLVNPLTGSAARVGQPDDQPESAPIAASSPPPLPSAEAPAAEASSPKRPGSGPTGPRQSTGNKTNSDRDTVVWLHQRMVQLQQERETRWQKIVKLLPGLS